MRGQARLLFVGFILSLPMVVLGASPRAALWLARIARALAFMEGRDHVLPDDLQRVAPAVLEHRLVLAPRARLAGATATSVVERALEEVPVPLAPGEDPPPEPA